MADPDLVFVYGLLMRGHELHHHMESGEFVGDGSVDGVLLSLGRYPGLIEGTGSVRGELYRFADLPSALDVLDDVEEFEPTDPSRSLYLRVAMHVKTDDGNDVEAWVYRYNGSTEGAERITSGEWSGRT
ncbi:MAG TPA: gamma-glutamylcyclotransferase family protein [Candidatus Eremiobacteraceae bacterium]|nr:gamma-glutamylcyclotransferase family protein [Candidatus Eremiobacteraceae bacterium]